jgi:hypothetical protein
MSRYLHHRIGEGGPPYVVSEDLWKPRPQEQLDDYCEDLQQVGKNRRDFGSLNGKRLVLYLVGFVEVEDPTDPLLDTQRDGRLAG